MATYNCKFITKAGIQSTDEVQASDQATAKKLVESKYGPLRSFTAQKKY